ncbi:hypothetical protein NIES4102_01630 [Chondrocystis sp. NIES-4102]|nr:hypothetical protein NIES4102_01630 [Chondrocystis sp. NIES-4102]
MLKSNNVLRLRYYFDAGSGICLWSADEFTSKKLGYAVELDDLPLSSNTSKWLIYLIAWFDTSIDWTYPTQTSLNWTHETARNFKTAYIIGLRMIQADLATSNFEIIPDEQYY